MNGEKSRDALFEFLDYLSSKGLMAKGTVASRKASCSKVLGILPADEAADITKLDLDSVMSRFQNLEGKNYTPQSLQTYLSRVKGAVKDFNSYLQNPLGYQPNIKTRNVKPKTLPKPPLLSTKLPASTQGAIQPHNLQVARVSDTIMPIQIRVDTIVHIQGLPFDLSEAEAEKIANVIKAMAT